MNHSCSPFYFCLSRSSPTLSTSTLANKLNSCREAPAPERFSRWNLRRERESAKTRTPARSRRCSATRGTPSRSVTAQTAPRWAPLLVSHYAPSKAGAFELIRSILSRHSVRRRRDRLRRPTSAPRSPLPQLPDSLTFDYSGCGCSSTVNRRWVRRRGRATGPASRVTCGGSFDLDPCSLTVSETALEVNPSVPRRPKRT